MNPTDVPGVLYSHTLKAFFDRVVFRRGLFSPGFRAGFSSPAYLAGLRALGVDPTRPRDVDLKTWVGILELTATTLAGHLPRDQALFEVGQEMVRGYEASVVGKTLFLTVRMMGTRRMVLQVADAFRTTDTIMKPQARELTPNSVEVAFAITGGVPTYLQGIFAETANLTGARDFKVTYVEEPGGRTVFTTAWA